MYKGRDHYLFSSGGALYLEKAHWEEGKSLREIAKEQECNAMLVSRAMTHHNIKKRTQSESYKEAVKRGKVGSPRGIAKDAKTKARIGKGLWKFWQKHGEARERASQKLKERWLENETEMLAYARKGLSSDKIKEIRNGTSFIFPKSPFRVAVEKLLEQTFGQVKMWVGVPTTDGIIKVDYWFEEQKLAIFLISPVRKYLDREEDIEKREDDRNAIMTEGGTVVWVHYYTNGSSIPIAHENCAKKVVELIKDIIKKPRKIGYRFIELTT